MAALVRVTGAIGFINVREGIARQSGNPYRMEIASVLVAGRGVVDVTLPRADFNGGQTYSQGDSVDWLVSVEPYGQNLSCSVVGDYPAELKQAEANAALAFYADAA